MENRLNAKTQIWADGYSFMEVTETLLMALGIRSEDTPSVELEPGQTEPHTLMCNESSQEMGANR